MLRSLTNYGQSMIGRAHRLRAMMLLSGVCSLGLAGPTFIGMAGGSAAEAQAAQENLFSHAELVYAERDVRIELDSLLPLRFPRVRTDDGFVRVWFPSMPGWANIDLAGDGDALRFARVRPGADDTGAIVVRLGDLRRIPESAVAVDVNGTHATISIARAVLAPVRPPGAPAATTAIAAGAAARPSAAEAAPASSAAVPSATGSTPAAAAPTAEVTGTSATATTAVDGTAPAAAPAPAATTAAAAASLTGRPRETTTGALPTPSRSMTSTLFGISLVLMGIFLFVRMNKIGGKEPNPKSKIRVLASQRLGPKHQLLVVRALGQDHFLSVDSGRTDRLLSLPIETQEEAFSEADLPKRQPFGFLKVLRGGKTPAEEESVDDKREDFGAELLRLAQAQTNKEQGVRARRESAAPESTEAVAGLLRMRAKAGR